MMADEKTYAQIFHRRFATSCSEMEISMLELAKEIVGGRRLTREEDCSFLLEADLSLLWNLQKIFLSAFVPVFNSVSTSSDRTRPLMPSVLQMCRILRSVRLR